MEYFKVIEYNGSRLVVVANFGNVNFRLPINFFRKINVIKPYILPLLQTDVSTSTFNQ